MFRGHFLQTQFSPPAVNSSKINSVHSAPSGQLVLACLSFTSFQRRATLEEYITSMMDPQRLEVDGARTFYHFGDHETAFAPLLKDYIIPRVWSNGPNLQSN